MLFALVIWSKYIENLHTVFVYRDMTEVQISLKKRNGFDESKTAKLYREYVYRYYENLGKILVPCSQVKYKDVLIKNDTIFLHVLFFLSTNIYVFSHLQLQLLQVIIHHLLIAVNLCWLFADMGNDASTVHLDHLLLM